VIHPTAIVDPAARLTPGVQVGPYSVIGAGVEVGEGTWIGPHVVINGPTRIGRANKIYQFASLGEAPQHMRHAGGRSELVIGDRNTVREYVTLNRGSSAGTGVTRIGDDNFIMATVHIAHDCEVGNHTIFANGASLAGHVIVHDHAVLGGYTLVHQFCKVGSFCITAAGSVVFKDVPPYIMASGYSAEPHGLNLRGLQRHGLSEETIQALRRAYKVLYKSGLLQDEALRQLDAMAQGEPHVAALAAFVRASERGIVR
jgi:UDP-N-acetylglucosamine acyltransferase